MTSEVGIEPVPAYLEGAVLSTRMAPLTTSQLVGVVSNSTGAVGVRADRTASAIDVCRMNWGLALNVSEYTVSGFDPFTVRMRKWSSPASTAASVAPTTPDRTR